MQRKSNRIGPVILAVLMVITFWVLLRDMPLARLQSVLWQLRPGWLVGGLGLMLLMLCFEASCTRQILPCLGHRTSLLRCLSYSFAGFYFSAITPSATGGQPAQIYCMARDGVSAAHGTLNMLLLAMCYQVTLLLFGALAAVLFPWLLVEMGSGMMLLLFYGILVNVALTVGMLCLMFLPNAARRICSGVLSLLVKLRLVRDRAGAETQLERQMEEYRRGADCLRRNPTLPVRLLGCTVLQLAALFSVPFMVYRAFGLSGHGVLELLGAQALLTLAVGSLPLPGAVGASEGGFLQAFRLFFGAGLVTPAVLVARGISFYSFMVLSGVISLAVHLYVRKSRGTGHVSPLPRPARETAA
ncbi:lysylphosphatidylglycerol synthase transmembrane domain-containing protein [uncultured Flavonifractor sp.]|uniref:lysylphosphatidylglycerol synthase transmembrane domain-containing protein n=1 Tax=uncultured Flavonifractor sp. TaxID=1193534 RepID=UPI002607BA72|nr:lysylphosphatidylglycerol synthase transmembrane domain-containing protein [uncultured Flavonifractor sp.]